MVTSRNEDELENRERPTPQRLPGTLWPREGDPWPVVHFSHASRTCCIADGRYGDLFPEPYWLVDGAWSVPESAEYRETIYGAAWRAERNVVTVLAAAVLAAPAPAKRSDLDKAPRTIGEHLQAAVRAHPLGISKAGLLALFPPDSHESLDKAIERAEREDTLDWYQSDDEPPVRVYVSKPEPVGAPRRAEAPRSAAPREPQRRTGIYIASKAKHGPRWRALRANGVPIISTWIDESEAGATDDWGDLWSRSISEASGAAAFIVYNEPGEAMKGALSEIGAALLAGVPVLWVGPDADLSGSEYTVVRHPLVLHAASLDEAVDLARALAGASDSEAASDVYRESDPPDRRVTALKAKLDSIRRRASERRGSRPNADASSSGTKNEQSGITSADAYKIASLVRDIAGSEECTVDEHCDRCGTPKGHGHRRACAVEKAAELCRKQGADPSTIERMVAATERSNGTRTLREVSMDALREEIARRISDGLGAEDDEVSLILPGGGAEETRVGRYWGIIATESDDGAPSVMFESEERARTHLSRCQAADPDGDDHLSEDHCVVRVDALTSTLNSFDQDPFSPPTCPPPFTLRTRSDVERTKRGP